MKVVTAAQMRHIDEVTIREYGVSGRELMERAGEAVAREVVDRFDPHAVLIVAGKGNNGGDGFVAARHLARMGCRVVVWALFEPADISGDAGLALLDMPEEIPIEQIESPDKLPHSLELFDVIVDAIFGTGIRGPVTGLAADVIGKLNASRLPVVAVDLPSGLPADSIALGEIDSYPHIRAAATVTIGLPKLGIVLDPGMRSAGQVTIADIGFSAALTESDEINVEVIGMRDARALLPKRLPWGNKGTFGKAIVIAGSEGMTGAAVLCARAAQRSGAGLVYVAYPEPLGQIMESHLIEPVKWPIPSTEPWFAESQAAVAIEKSEAANAVAIGPGLGTRDATGAFVHELIAGISLPLVIDADGLNHVSKNPDSLVKRKGPTILTPHPGEAARLLECSIVRIESNRLEASLALARAFNAVIILKGSQTIITAPNGTRTINPTGNSGLAKGGSGDVLTGLLVGLLAQGCDPVAAAKLGVFLHGLAADRAARKIGVRAMIASDVIDYLGEAFIELEKA